MIFLELAYRLILAVIEIVNISMRNTKTSIRFQCLQLMKKNPTGYEAQYKCIY